MSDRDCRNLCDALRDLAKAGYPILVIYTDASGEERAVSFGLNPWRNGKLEPDWLIVDSLRDGAQDFYAPDFVRITASSWTEAIRLFDEHLRTFVLPNLRED